MAARRARGEAAERLGADGEGGLGRAGLERGAEWRRPA